jgi:hypothetical protein
MKWITLFLFVGLISYETNAQSSFWINGQIRPRMEMRNGYKTLQSDTSTIGLFIEQRSRISLGYKNTFAEFFVAVQDIRVWGSTPLVNQAAGNFGLFEGWGKIKLNTNFSLKIGRQVWSYDNQRILGGLNWLAQARAHDGVLLAYQNDSSTTHLQLGLAYNVATASLNQIPYTVGGNYKTMQFVRFRKLFKSFNFSILAMNLGQESNSNATKINFELTAGGIFNINIKRLAITLEGYYQYGYGKNDLLKNAYLGAFKLKYKLDNIHFGLGADWLSGTERSNLSTQDNAFNPWMGTNHIFYGHLDYFYVGSSHGNVGLIDGYASIAYQKKGKWKTTLAYHYFHAPSDLSPLTAPSNSLGHEIDFTFHYTIQKYLKLHLGYAHLIGNQSLEQLKPTGEVNNINNWAWLMLDFNMEIFRYKKEANKNTLHSQRF